MGERLQGMQQTGASNPRASTSLYPPVEIQPDQLLAAYGVETHLSQMIRLRK